MKILHWMIFYRLPRGGLVPIYGTNNHTRRDAKGLFSRECGKTWDQLSPRYECKRVIIEVEE